MIIYKLIDPETREARYIGQTSMPARRLTQHITDARHSDHDRARWIRSLVAQGLKPEMVIIEEVPSKEADKRELFWIHTMIKRGEQLTNKPLTYADLMKIGIVKPFRQRVVQPYRQLSLFGAAA